MSPVTDQQEEIRKLLEEHNAENRQVFSRPPNLPEPTTEENQ